MMTAQTSLLMTSDLLDELHAYARKHAPLEACGLLAGAGEMADRFFPIRNTEASEVNYRMDTAQQFAAMRAIEKGGRRVLAIWHSHPASQPFPSTTDVARAFFPGTREPNYPDVTYLITGMAGSCAETRGFMILETGITETKLGVVETTAAEASFWEDANRN